MNNDFYVTFGGSIYVEPEDFIECENCTQLEESVKEYIIDVTGCDLEYLDEFDISDDFYNEWESLREQINKENQNDFDENN